MTHWAALHRRQAREARMAATLWLVWHIGAGAALIVGIAGICVGTASIPLHVADGVHGATHLTEYR